MQGGPEEKPWWLLSVAGWVAGRVAVGRVF